MIPFELFNINKRLNLNIVVFKSCFKFLSGHTSHQAFLRLCHNVEKNLILPFCMYLQTFNTN